MDWNGQSAPRKPQKSFEEFFQDFFNRPDTMMWVALLVVAGLGILTCYYTVKAEERAVVTRLGRYVYTATPGLHFRFPFGIDRVQKVSSRVQQESFGYIIRDNRRTSSLGRARDQTSARTAVFRPPNLDEESLMLTGDLNVADVEWVVEYLITEPYKYLFNVADPIKNIRDISQATMRRVIGDTSINDVITTGRRAVETEARTIMQKIIDDYGIGITLTQVILQNVNPPEPVQPSFNEVNSALQEQKQAINRAEADYNKIIPEARGKAEEQITEARGYAAAIVNRSQGDAEKFDQILREYKKAPRITRTRLYLEMVEELMGRVESFTVVDPAIKGVLPVFPAPTTSAGVVDSLTRSPRASLKEQG